MAVTDKKVKDFENNYKNRLFNQIHALTDMQTKLISLIYDEQKYIGIDETLPNIGITLNNKLVEMSHTFQEAGISMFSSKIEDYGPLNLNIVTSSFVGEAVILDMIDKVVQGTEILEKYNSRLQQMHDPKYAQFQLLETSGPLKKFLLKLRGFFVPSKKIDLSYSQEEKQELTSYLSEYVNIDSKLWTYSLRDNIVHALVGYIKQNGYPKNSLPALLEECVTPDLQKLGLADLIPQLEEQLAKTFEEESQAPKNSWDLSPDKKRRIQEGQQAIAQKYNFDLENQQSHIEPVLPSQEEVK